MEVGGGTDGQKGRHTNKDETWGRGLRDRQTQTQVSVGQTYQQGRDMGKGSEGQTDRQTQVSVGQTYQQGRDMGKGSEGQTERQTQVSVGQTYQQGRDMGKGSEGQTDRQRQVSVGQQANKDETRGWRAEGQTDRNGHAGGQTGKGRDKGMGGERADTLLRRTDRPTRTR